MQILQFKDGIRAWRSEEFRNRVSRCTNGSISDFSTISMQLERVIAEVRAKMSSYNYHRFKSKSKIQLRTIRIMPVPIGECNKLIVLNE